MHKHEKNHKQKSWGIFKAIADFLFPVIDEPISGGLVVSGKGSSEFTFPHYPEEIVVFFEGGCEPIPCNPGTDDILEWHLIEYECHFSLIIEWDVASTRKIVWRTC